MVTYKKVPNVVFDWETLIILENWLLTRGGDNQRFNCNLLFFLHPVRWHVTSLIIVIICFLTVRRQPNLQEAACRAGHWLILRRLQNSKYSLVCLSHLDCIKVWNRLRVMISECRWWIFSSLIKCELDAYLHSLGLWVGEKDCFCCTCFGKEANLSVGWRPIQYFKQPRRTKAKKLGAQ